jgi:hypothetical protein
VAASAIKDTVNLTVAVPGLELLPDGQNYVKVGGTCDHHGPSDRSLAEVPENCQTPDHTHWGTANLISSLRAIADSFAVAYPGYRLRINDVSLDSGGGFDIGGHWEADIVDQFPESTDTCNLVGHCSHRIGRNADIGTVVLNPVGTQAALGRSQLKVLEDIITEIIGRKPGTEGNHYHVRGRS